MILEGVGGGGGGRDEGREGAGGMEWEHLIAIYNYCLYCCSEGHTIEQMFDPEIKNNILACII